MKQLRYALGMSLLFVSLLTIAQQPFTVTVKLKNMPGSGKLFVVQDNGKTWSAVTDNGKAVIKGDIPPGVSAAMLLLDNAENTKKGKMLTIFLDKDPLTITGDYTNLIASTLKGSKINKDLNQFNKQFPPGEPISDETTHYQNLVKYLQKNPYSYAAILTLYADRKEIPKTMIREAYEASHKSIREYKYGKALLKYLPSK